MKLSKIVAIILVIFLFTKVNSQTLQIGNVTSCPGDSILVPINMIALDSIGAITLFISFDTNSVMYQGIVNINPLATGITYNNVHTGVGNTGPQAGEIAISWTNSTGGISFGTSLFANIKFKIIGNSCNLHLLNTCEIANYIANVINVNYINGSVTSKPLPTINIQPVSKTINYGESTYFKVDANNSNTIQWQIKHGSSAWSNIQNNTVFNGATTDSLSIVQPDSIYNAYSFRALLTNDCSTLYSDIVNLTINTASVNELKYANNIKIYPNPAKDFIIIENINLLNTITDINIYQTNGTLIKTISYNAFYNKNIKIQLSDLHLGEYLVEAIIKSNSISRKVYYKVIKAN